MARRTPARVVVALVAFALFGASCSDHSSRVEGGEAVTTAPAPTVPVVADPCALVTLTQAQGLIGGAELLPGLGVRTADPDDRSCSYTAPPNSTSQHVEVLLGPRAKSALDQERTDAKKVVAVARIGHEAYEEDSAIFFRKRSTWVAIRVDDKTAATTGRVVLRRRLEALARGVAPKI